MRNRAVHFLLVIPSVVLFFAERGIPRALASRRGCPSVSLPLRDLG
jgi:hypothetical protein